jgi:heme-degrading monooxygenase HmoA
MMVNAVEFSQFSMPAEDTAFGTGAGRLRTMILEVALITVVPGQEDAFAKAYAEGRAILAATPGCRSVRMTRGIESPSKFVLLVEWDSVQAHEDNFRATDRFTAWRALIGPHFDGSPHVEHYADID